MGCGASLQTINNISVSKSAKETDNQKQFHSFNVFLINLEQRHPHKLSANFNIIQEENFEIIKGLRIPEYIFNCSNKELKDLFRNTMLINNCIFFLYYFDVKLKKTCDYFEVMSIIPYDEMLLIETNGLLQKMYILDIRSIIKLNMSYEDVLEQLKEVYEILEHQITIKKREPKETEAEKIDEIVEDEVVVPFNGTVLQINRDIKQETLEICLQRIKNEEVVTFIIRKNHFNDINLFKILLKELSQLKNLQTFTFSDNYNTSGFDEGWRTLIYFFKQNKTLRHINFCLSYLYDKFLTEIMDALKNKRIESLDLSSNFITSIGCQKIAEWIDTNKYLKVLNLSQNTMNEFKKEGSDFIVSKLIRHKQIRVLDLSNMNLTGLGEKLSELILNTISLSELKIQNVRLNLDDYKSICQAMCQNETIAELNISDNNCGSDKAYLLISEFIKVNKTLKTLKIENLGIKEKNSSQLFESIKINETINFYSLDCNEKLSFSVIYNTFINKKEIKVISFRLNEGKAKLIKESAELIEDFKKSRKDILLLI